MKRKFALLTMMAMLVALVAPSFVVALQADVAAAVTTEPTSIPELIALVLTFIKGGASVTTIVGLTLVIMQLIKNRIGGIPTKLVAVGIGAGLTALALFGLHSIQGEPTTVFTAVILAVLGAPTLYEVLNGK